MRAGWAAALLAAMTIPSWAGDLPTPPPKLSAVTLLAGVATNTDYAQSIFMPWTNDLRSIGMVGAAYTRQLANVGDLIGDDALWGEASHFTIDGELGTSMRFGNEHLGEVWGALYLRYDDFPWNDTVYTTLAVDTGLSFLSEKSMFEKGRDDGGKASQLLHYMGPELTFADPANKDLEFVLRYHHRSGVFGLFNGVWSGSTFISTGVRMHF